MLQPIVLVFLFFGVIFAATHTLAVDASLYWYYPWFDVVMHTWGGVMVALGVLALKTLKPFRDIPAFWFFITALALAIVSWEIFEWYAGLYDPETHVRDTIEDVALGTFGGLVTFYLLTHKKNR
ncbi:MAG: hypothetical protein AAB388_04175 [Patescibacteria group bacterium]